MGGVVRRALAGLGVALVALCAALGLVATAAALVALRRTLGL